jgi:diadenosine tetraphosphate (Ap4A) HIT family hydrolase
MADSWMPRDKWEALVRGESCPLCTEVASIESFNEYGYTIKDLSFSRLRLCANQYIKGYCVLICHKHVREPYELPQDEREMFFDDMMRAGLALEQVFRSDKMNFQILGNAVPHLHCHLEPRYLGDPAPHRPIHSGEKTVTLTQDEYRQRIQQIRDALDIVIV